MNKLHIYLITGFLLLCFFVEKSSAQQETKIIILKDGTTIQGTVVAETESTQVVRTQYGTLEIKRSDIVKQENAGRSPSQQTGSLSQTIQLKDGTVIKGVIREQTADTLEVESTYGIMKIPRSSVRRLNNRVAPEREQQERPVREGQERPVQSEVPSVIEDSYHAWEIIGGVAVPTGEFASTALFADAAGFASVGGCLGLRYRVEATKRLEAGLLEVFGYYPMNQSEYSKYFQSGTRVDAGGWFLFWTMGSLGLNFPIPPSSRFHFGGLLGIMMGISPSLNVSNGGTNADQSTAAATTFSYGGDMGFIFHPIDIELRYMAARPEYSLHVSSSNGSFTGKAKQPTATIQLTLGVIVN